MPKSKTSLPNKLLAIPNADKKFHERWYKNRNLLNIPHPFRAIICGRPDSGKSTVVKNIILRAYPPYQEIYIIHCDPDNTHEYDDLGESNVHISNIIPDPDEWNSDKKKLCIIDDLELKSLSKMQSKNLDRLFGYVSTHKNLSAMICQQEFYNLPTLIRRCSNVWIIWKFDDEYSMPLVSKKAGLSQESLKFLFRKCTDKHDSIWIDKTDKSPAPLRFNGYEVLDHNQFTK